MKRILIDTNALMAIAEFKLDIFRELEQVCDFPYKVCVLQGTIRELETIIKEQRLRYRQAAKLALALIPAKKVTILEEEKYVDEVLVEHSRRGDLVLTVDKVLKQKLAPPYLTIRARKKIAVVE